MSKLYLPLDVDFDDDEKIARLARYTKPCEARACRDLLVGMWRYCKRERSDGSVPAEIIGKLAYPDSPKIGRRDADRLVEIGIAEATDDGYYLPGYLKRNKSRAQLEAEAVKKAEAGRKGGLASGEVRKGEADAKHGASPVPSQRQRQKTEDNDVPALSGDRLEPLRAVADTDPPKCAAHPAGDFDGPCGGCKRVREYGDRNEAQAKRDALAAAANCSYCHGTNWREDDDGNPTRKCNHRRTA